MPGIVFIRGERVTLRTIENEEEDIDLLQRAYEPAFRDGLLFRRPNNREQVESSIEEAAEKHSNVELLVCRDEEPLGEVSLFDIRYDTAKLAYWLLPEHRGEGYITEAAGLLLDHAFDTLGFHHVVAWTIDYNEASQAVLRRLGFTHEGTCREHVFRKGEHHDTEYYGILDDEWDGSATIVADHS